MTRLLLIDEDTVYLKHLAFELHKLNPDLHCESAPGGGEALSLLNREHYDAVVTHWRLPGMEGAYLVAELVERHPEVPVVAVSGRDHPALEKVFDDFCVQWLVRPFEVEELNRCIGRTGVCRTHRGNLRRVHLGNFIRLAQEHGRSISVRVQNIATGDRADLELTRGRVTGAVWGDASRERVFRELLGWDEVNLQIVNGPRFREELHRVLERGGSPGGPGLFAATDSYGTPGDEDSPPMSLEDVFGPDDGSD
jgi:DNA-binding response OmpR family regulator